MASDGIFFFFVLYCASYDNCCVDVDWFHYADRFLYGFCYALCERGFCGFGMVSYLDLLFIRNGFTMSNMLFGCELVSRYGLVWYVGSIV